MTRKVKISTATMGAAIGALYSLSTLTFGVWMKGLRRPTADGVGYEEESVNALNMLLGLIYLSIQGPIPGYIAGLFFDRKNKAFEKAVEQRVSDILSKIESTGSTGGENFCVQWESGRQTVYSTHNIMSGNQVMNGSDVMRKESYRASAPQGFENC